MKTLMPKDVYIDFLCWSSAFKTVVHLRKDGLGKVYYVNVSRFFVPFVKFLEKTLKSPVVQIEDIVLGEEKLEGVSLYETVHDRIETLLSEWIAEEEMAKFIMDFCTANQLNPDKFEVHLKEAAFELVYRPVEMSVISDYLSGKNPVSFVLRRSPLSVLMSEGFDTVYFYRTFFSHTVAVENRNDYFYDTFVNKGYFAGRFKTIGRFWYRWLKDLAGSLFSGDHSQKADYSVVRIGVELTQNRVRHDEINDISWLQSSGIEMENVCGLQMENFDEQSVVTLNELKIPRYVIAGGACDAQSLKNAKTIGIQRRYLLSTVGMVVGLLKCLLMWNEDSWLRLQSVRYVYRSMFWYSIYEQLGIKVLWTMYDMDEDKLAKGQAIELLGGLYTGGHWSNLLIHHVHNQKCFDVLFTWGEHFVRNNFNRYPFMAIFFTGYPCDYYFKMHKHSAGLIRKRHEGKFIISYHDNVMRNDLPYSKSMQLDIHRVLISLLRKFENVVVFLKPKRKFVLDEIIKDLPELQEMIDR
ncbi:MAG: hypothetical protein JNN05_05880, partial [Candidatus Omnitrophica bacterium]|nr:hypothetical protein [Candidatus Omnitrophota bacterium]